MNKRLALALAPGTIGLSGIIPYISPILGGNNSFFTRWGGIEEVTMKPITSFSFLVASLLLISTIDSIEKTTKEVGLFLVILIFSGFLHVNDDSDQVMTVGLNTPSVGTLVVFLSLGIGGILPGLMKKAGMVIFGMSTIAILGHLMNVEAMFYFWDGWSTAMARPTAVAGLLVGLFVLTSDDY